MKKDLKMTKGTVLILILVLASSVVLGIGIKDLLSQQGGDGNYVASAPTPESASVWDVFDEGAPDAGNESGEPDMGGGASRCHQQNLSLNRPSSASNRKPSLRYSIAILYG